MSDENAADMNDLMSAVAMGDDMTGRALLFDLDGTLTDTDAIHLAAFNRLLEPSGRHLTPDDYKTQIMGYANLHIMRRLFPSLSDQDHQRLSDEKEQYFRDAAINDLVPTAGLSRLLSWARHHAIPVAVVTNAPRRNADFMLRALGLAYQFDTIVIGDELPHGKPHPLPYQTALSRLGRDARSAIAFEDSFSGITSACAAGIFTVGIRTSLDSEQLRTAGAALTIADFKDVSLWALLEQNGSAYQPR